MSLLGTQVYANTVTPNWVGANGGTVRGDLNIQSPGGAIDFLDASGNSISRIVAEKAGTQPNEGVLYLQSDVAVAFTTQNNSQYNSFLTIDDFGGEDLLVVGGQTNTRTLGLSGAAGTGACGFAQIALGANNVVVPTTAISLDDIILFTRIGNPSSGPGSGVGQGGLMYLNSDIVEGVSFKVYLVDPATGIITNAVTTSADFYWVIIKKTV
jgi:hypothetical protein